MNVKSEIARIIAANKAISLTNAPTDIVEAGELINKRTAAMKVFDAGNGQRRAHIYACPIHFKDTDEIFRSIDSTVKRKPLADSLQQYKYETKSGAYHAHFDQDKPWNYRMEVGNSWIEYEAQFEESDVLNIQVETSRIGVKETITLKDNTAPTKLSWRVTRSGSGIITPLPNANDADGKDVPVKVSQVRDILTYEVDTTDAVFPVKVDPTSVQATNDGTVVSTNSVYATARDATAGGSVVTSAIYAGDYYASPNYRYYRSFFSFAIPDMSSCTACSLFLDGLYDGSDTEFNIYIHTSTYSNPLVVEDFDQFDGWQASGAYNGTVLNDTWNSADYSADWNEIVFNADGLAVVLAAKETTLRLALISKEDYDNSIPTNYEYLVFSSTETADKEPYISITYIELPNINESIDVTVEVEAAVTRKLTLPVDATAEMEATVTRKLIKPVVSLVEMECTGTLTIGIVKAVLAVLGMQVETVKHLKKNLQPLVEMEAAVTRKWSRAVQATVEMEATVTRKLTHAVSSTVAVTAAIIKYLKKHLQPLVEVEASADLALTYDYLIDLSYIPDYDQYTVWKASKQNTVKNEIINKFNWMIDTDVGHIHDGIKSKSLFDEDYDIDDLTSLINMRALD